MYETRFVYQLPLSSAGDVGNHVADVVQATGHGPTNVNFIVDESESTVTVTYMTQTTRESDHIINNWKRINGRVQVERTHKINPDHFRNLALAGEENRKLRSHIALEVERMCLKGVGSKGVLDYLLECESVIVELKELVQSKRASV
jgi:hypothetical protein